MREYPRNHKEVVSRLLDGKFILYPDSLFNTLVENDNEYIDFFKKTFDFDLIIEPDFAYLSSQNVNEKRTRDFTLFLAILCRELDYSGKNFKERIENGTFEIQETHELLRQSSKWEILEQTTVSDFNKFIGTWKGKNLLIVEGDKFKFTKAVKLFFRFAMEIAQEKLKEQNKSIEK